MSKEQNTHTGYNMVKPRKYYVESQSPLFWFLSGHPHTSRSPFPICLLRLSQFPWGRKFSLSFLLRIAVLLNPYSWSSWSFIKLACIPKDLSRNIDSLSVIPIKINSYIRNTSPNYIRNFKLINFNDLFAKHAVITPSCYLSLSI